jgi:predicted alpha/beta hydrolase family esterase
MWLMFLPEVGGVVNLNATSLTLLILLALGTFVAGVHAAVWRISAVGVFLALSVPAVAWVQESAILLLIGALLLAVIDLPDGGFDVVAHSLGAVLWLHHVPLPHDAPRPARVALVAPPSPRTTIPEIAAFFPPPLDVDAIRHGADGTVLIAGDNDPYLPEGIGSAYALPLRIATTVIPGGGHLNVEAGYGEWPAMLAWCNRDHLAFF